MGTLTGLKGTNGQAIECVFIEKGTDIEGVLGDGLAATSAGGNGALNIYKDDEGNIRCEAMRYCQTMEEKIFGHAKPVIKWADKWLLKIQ